MNDKLNIQDRDLLLRLKQDDHLAFNIIYERYSAATLTKLKRLVHLNEIAEELHQDVFMKIWESRLAISPDVPIIAIVHQKAKTLAYNFYKKAALDKALRERIIAISTERYDGLEEQLAFDETNEQLMATIALLPEKRRQVFTSIKMEGKTYEEVAQELNISLSTVKDHMTRALKFLREKLSEELPGLLMVIFCLS